VPPHADFFEGHVYYIKSKKIKPGSGAAAPKKSTRQVTPKPAREPKPASGKPIGPELWHYPARTAKGHLRRFDEKVNKRNAKGETKLHVAARRGGFVYLTGKSAEELWLACLPAFLAPRLSPWL